MTDLKALSNLQALSILDVSRNTIHDISPLTGLTNLTQLNISSNKISDLSSIDKLVKCFMKHNEWSYEEALEWVEYNVERALPYYGEHAPLLLQNKFIHSDNKYYEPIKVK